jgi:hypothetical protein
MKNKLISQLSTVLLTVFFSSTLIGQVPIKQEDIHVVLRNSISNEVKTFLNSDSVIDRNKENYLSLTSGLNFFSYQGIPTNLKSAFLDPIAYGLDPLKSEYIRYASDSNVVSNVLVFQVKDIEKFKSKFANDEIVNFNAKNGIIELYNNTAFIKGSKLVYIYSESSTSRHRYYDNSFVEKSNFVEAVESSFEQYCTNTEAADILATPLHLRQHPDYPDAGIPTIEQIKLSRKYGVTDNYYYSYEYASATGSESVDEDLENELYGIKSSIFIYNEENDAEIDPLSFYKGYKRNYSYESYADSAAVEVYEEEEYDYDVEEAVEAVADTAYYEDYSYGYDEVAYSDPYENLSKRDQRKLKRLRAKEQKILAKTGVDQNFEYEEDNYTEYEEEESSSYQSFKYYKLCELYDNKRYAAPFLEAKFSISSDKKSYTDFKNSKSATAVWVNQESLIQVLYKDMLSNFNFNDKLISNKNEYLKDCAMLFELDYTQKDKSIVSLKGYGNKTYLNDIKSVFDTKIPANWLTNVPSNAPVVAGVAIDNLKLTNFYKNILTQTFAASSDTLMKEWFNIVQAFFDEDAIGRIINGKTLFYVDGVVKFNKVYSSYEYDEDYNYKNIEKEEEVTYPRFAAFVGTDDKSVIQSYLNLTQYFGYLKEKNGIYTIYSRSIKKKGEKAERYNEHIFMSFINNALVISNDSILLKSIINNKKTNNAELSKTFEQNKVYMKVDFEKSINLLTNTDFAKNNSDIKRLKNFEKMELTGLDFDENKFTLKLNFEQKATGENQIETVFDLFNF